MTRKDPEKLHLLKDGKSLKMDLHQGMPGWRGLLAGCLEDELPGTFIELGQIRNTCPTSVKAQDISPTRSL